MVTRSALVLLFGSALLAVSASAAEVVGTPFPYTFPAYGSVDDLRFYADPPEYDAAVQDPAFRFEKLRYPSDGLRVVAYLYRPARLDGKKLPLIVFSRGSGPMGDTAPLLITFFHRLAAQGYVVLAPQYRESDGGEGKDTIGGDDLDDVKNVLPLAESLGYVDTRNVFLYGESRGGMMTYQLIRDGFPANAAAVFGAFTDLEIMAEAPQAKGLVARFWPDWDTHKQAIVERRSARYWPEKLDVPLLIMNGGADPQVNPSQPLNLALQLSQLGKPYSLVIYAEGNHNLTKDRLDRDQRALAWFERYRKP